MICKYHRRLKLFHLDRQGSCFIRSGAIFNHFNRPNCYSPGSDVLFVFLIMALSILVLIQSNPLETHRPTEGLRIALGLSTGVSSLTVVLLGQARTLLTEETSDVVDVEILERHLPVIRELQLPIVVPEGSAAAFPFDPELAVREVSRSGITSLLCQADRVLVF